VTLKHFKSDRSTHTCTVTSQSLNKGNRLDGRCSITCMDLGLFINKSWTALRTTQPLIKWRVNAVRAWSWSLTFSDCRREEHSSLALVTCTSWD